MATKKEVWVDSCGDEHGNELAALVSDLRIEMRKADTEEFSEFYVPALTPALVAAIDALHAHAHRNDKTEIGRLFTSPAAAREYVQSLKRGDVFHYLDKDGARRERVVHDFQVDPVDGLTTVVYYRIGHRVSVYSMREYDLIQCVIDPSTVKESTSD